MTRQANIYQLAELLERLGQEASYALCEAFRNFIRIVTRRDYVGLRGSRLRRSNLELKRKRTSKSCGIFSTGRYTFCRARESIFTVNYPLYR